MPMKGQIDHLTDHRHVSEKPEGLLRSEIVEGFHNVVGDEGHGPVYALEHAFGPTTSWPAQRLHNVANHVRCRQTKSTGELLGIDRLGGHKIISL